MPSQAKPPYTAEFEEDETRYRLADSYEEGERPTDIDSFYRKMEKLDSLLQKTLSFASLIPDMGAKFERIGLRLAELSTQFTNVASRVSKMEVKVDRGHECVNRDSIREALSKLDQLFLSVVEVRERADSTSEDVRELANRITSIENARRQASFAFLGSLFALLSTIGSLIWFLSALSRDVRHESETRQRQVSEITERLEARNAPR